MNKLFSCLLLLLAISPARADMQSSCVTTKKFMFEFNAGIGAPTTSTSYDLRTTLEILKIFYEQFGMNLSMLDPKKVEGSTFVSSNRFPHVILMLLTTDKGQVICYNAPIDIKMYKYAIKKLGIRDI